MTPKKALCIHSFSTMGRSSTAVIAPALAAKGIQPVMLPTVVLSTHYGITGPIAKQDMTQFCKDALEHYKHMGVSFDCVFSGFLSSKEQMDIIKDAYTLTENGLKLCDPVMADHGKLYSSITDELVEGFKELCRYADLITPNPTEALILLGRDCKQEIFTKEEASEIVSSLGEMYADVIITGTKFADGSVACTGYDKEKKEVFFIPLNYLPVSYPGTGDLFGACLSAFMLDGNDLKTACEKTARFVEKVVGYTYQSGDETKFGVHIEPMLKYLID
ncbi:MAG: pyridoxamine kinase [Oscillospiraceae bacterium]|nr:pyridoxamine kinase [Oscillospiraceae bacterium]MBR6608854.1 pyridoxamine kinase [Oscillospiraceae bacterium]